MKKVSIPTKEQLMEVFIDELRDCEIGIAGEIEAFSTNLYKSFRKYIKGREYKDKLLYEFVFGTVDDLLYDDSPSQRTDSSLRQQAAGE
jgi:hypothetical protein